jgi:ribosomal protein S18 acetylase RimI-like enzyme
MDALREIQRAALAEPWPELLPAAVEGILSCVVITAEENHAAVERCDPVGYVVYIPGGETAYLPELAVSPDRQNEGYGSTLLEAVCEDLAQEGYASVRLTAHAADERVQQFYERHGFAAVERAPDQFEDGDGIVFERRLDSAD